MNETELQNVVGGVGTRPPLLPKAPIAHPCW